MNHFDIECIDIILIQLLFGLFKAYQFTFTVSWECMYLTSVILLDLFTSFYSTISLQGAFRESNLRPLAPKTRIIALDQMPLLSHLKHMYESLGLGIKVVFCCIARNT